MLWAMIALVPGVLVSADVPNLNRTRRLATNGGFEEGLKGWTVEGGELVSGRRVVRGGRNCLRFGQDTRLAAGADDNADEDLLDLDSTEGTKKKPAPAVTYRLSRAFDLKTGCLYEFSMSVRGTIQKGKAAKGNMGVKAVVFLRNDARKVRRPLDTISALPTRWTQLGGRFQVPSPGNWTIELLAPTADGMPGRVWVDDFSLIETSFPPRIPVTDDTRYNERPVLAAAADGSAYCAFISYHDDRDTIRLARMTGAGSAEPAAAPLADIDLPGCKDVWSLAMAGGETEAWLAASCEVDGNWDIYLWKIDAGGVSKATCITKGPAKDDVTDINPSITVAGDRVLLAWETNRDGERSIMTAAAKVGGAGAPRRLSKPGTWNYHPSIAGDASGKAWLVWESFRDGNYDIYGAQYDGGEWSAERALSKDPRLEHRPVVAFGKDGAWMAWEVMTYGYPRYRPGAAAEQRVVVARLDADGLKSTEGIYDLFKNLTQQPAIVCDSAGRVYVSARESRGWWGAALRVFCGNRWVAGPELAPRPATGRAHPSPLAVAGDRLLLAVQEVVQTSKRGVLPRVEKSNIAVSSLDFGKILPPVNADLGRLTLPETDFDPAGQRKLYGEDLPKRTIEYKGQKLHLAWGQFHEHSDISQCARSADLCPEDNYCYHRDIHRMDFCAITDHGYNLNAPNWHYLSKTVKTQQDAGVFVTFLAEEWTSEAFHKGKHKHPIYGHRNIIFGDPEWRRWFDACDGESPFDIWKELKSKKADFIQIPHQLACTLSQVHWDYADEVAQPVAEIFQVRGSYEYRGCPRQAGAVARDGHWMWDAWKRGLVIGVIASPDHRGGLGKAAVYVPELTRAAILEACRKRHTYGTTAAKIFLDFRVNGALMGEKINAPGKPVKIHVEVEGTLPLECVEICRSNKWVYKKKCDSKKCVFDWEDPEPLPDKSYYYVRVLQKSAQIVDKNSRRPLEHAPEIAWSSPVWVER